VRNKFKNNKISNTFCPIRNGRSLDEAFALTGQSRCSDNPFFHGIIPDRVHFTILVFGLLSFKRLGKTTISQVAEWNQTTLARGVSYQANPFFKKKTYFAFLKIHLCQIRNAF
jgi:hypothetical protein